MELGQDLANHVYLVTLRHPSDLHFQTLCYLALHLVRLTDFLLVFSEGVRVCEVLPDVHSLVVGNLAMHTVVVKGVQLFFVNAIKLRRPLADILRIRKLGHLRDRVPSRRQAAVFIDSWWFRFVTFVFLEAIHETVLGFVAVVVAKEEVDCSVLQCLDCIFFAL